jgi:4-hydroxybenzoate polyprenyltransferase
MAGFLRRNPILRTKKQLLIDSVRVNGATSDIIKLWFQKLELPAIKAIKPDNRWNMDEAGIMEGQGENGLVVGSVDRRLIQKKQPGSKAWTSFIECISVPGKALRPLVMFKGKSVQQQWFPTGLSTYEGWEFTATDNGWTSDATALEWLQKVFLPQTAPQDPSEARLLILDGHGSHETMEFMWECYSSNIYLLFLPPHTSHVLQPLDLSIFAPLKRAYRKQLGFLSLLNDSTPLGKQNFLSCYQKARLSSLTRNNIRAGWQASGLWPINMAKPLMNRLLLENSNKSTKQASKALEKEPVPDWSIEGSFIEWETPLKGKDIREQARQITSLKDTDSATCRVLFRKVAKGLDQKDFVIAQHELRIKQLEARVVQLELRKRRKV